MSNDHRRVHESPTCIDSVCRLVERRPTVRPSATQTAGGLQDGSATATPTRRRRQRRQRSFRSTPRDLRRPTRLHRGRRVEHQSRRLPRPRATRTAAAVCDARALASPASSTADCKDVTKTCQTNMCVLLACKDGKIDGERDRPRLRRHLRVPARTPRSAWLPADCIERCLRRGREDLHRTALLRRRDQRRGDRQRLRR